jgi:hypothetical protein
MRPRASAHNQELLREYPPLSVMASRFLMQCNPPTFPKKLFHCFPFSQSSDQRTFVLMVSLNASL